MGCPIRSLKQFESELAYYNKNWAVIIFANAYSDSRAVDFVIRDFHIMDRISDDVNFYMPGYCLSWDRSRFDEPSTWMNNELNEAHKDYHCAINYEQTFSNRWIPFTRKYKQKRSTDKGYSIIESPRLGPIYFSDADFADFIMEFTRQKKGYIRSGACELILLPIVERKADYLASRVYDMDAIIDCPSGNSLDYFLHQLFQIMRNGSTLNDTNLWSRLFNRSADVLMKADRLYNESVSSHFADEKYEIVIRQVVLDIERCIHWSLQEEFYFISYSSRNVMLAENLKLEMQDMGKKVWIAPDGIPQGREYSLVIPTTLKLAKNFVLLLTPDSAHSHWVKRELDIAISNGPSTRVKVVLAEGYTINDIRHDNELYFYLNRVQIRYEYTEIMEDPSKFSAFIEG